MLNETNKIKNFLKNVRGAYVTFGPLRRPYGGGHWPSGHVSRYLLTKMLVGTYLLDRTIKNEYQMLHPLYTMTIMLS
jgi:hypothetical protein